MEQISLVLERRTVLGKKVKALRRQRIVPVHLYGPGIQSQALQLASHELVKAITLAGRTTPLQVRVKGGRKRHVAFVREVQWDPLRGDLLHVDLMRVELTHRMRAQVPIELVGEAPGLREYRATVVQNIASVEVEALPLNIPHRIEADISILTDLAKAIRARDLPLAADVVLLSDGNDMVARLEPLRVEVPVAEEAVEEEVPSEEPEAGPETPEEGTG